MNASGGWGEGPFSDKFAFASLRSNGPFKESFFPFPPDPYAGAAAPPSLSKPFYKGGGIRVYLVRIQLL